MNAFRYETASLIAADRRLVSLSTQFTTGRPRLRPSHWRTLLDGHYTSVCFAAAYRRSCEAKVAALKAESR